MSYSKYKFIIASIIKEQGIDMLQIAEETRSVILSEFSLET